MNSHRRPPLFIYPFPILFPRDLSGGKSPCGGRNIFIRTKKYLLAEGKIFLHIRKNISAYTKIYFCIYEKIFLHIQKFIYVRTEKNFYGHGKKFLWAWKKISMGMEKKFYGHGKKFLWAWNFYPLPKAFFLHKFPPKVSTLFAESFEGS
ncbi:hypothetical protein HQ29_07930 [Porphyromonas canoris]|nr:hypothetical protein HQ29_07930 [Porphyromonas canoris]